MKQATPIRVLVVDDHHDGAETLGIALQQLGCDVRLTYSGEEAMEVAPTFEPELVILDLNMPPGMDGYQTAVQLRGQIWAVKATFVAHTGSSDPEVVKKVKKAGFRYFVPKPANPSAFEVIVAALHEI
jgi:CheY-like chemotaxis protein